MKQNSAALADQPEAIVSSIDKETLSKAYALRTRKLGEAQAQIFRLQAEQQAEQDERSQEKAQHLRAVMLRDIKLARATTSLYEAEAETEKLKTDREQRFKEITYLTRRLLAAEETIERLEKQQKSLVVLQQDLKESAKRIEARDAKIATQKEELQNLRTQQQEHDALVKELRSHVAERDAHIRAYRDSSSWKITGPIRAVVRLLRGQRPSFQ